MLGNIIMQRDWHVLGTKSEFASYFIWSNQTQDGESVWEKLPLCLYTTLKSSYSNGWVCWQHFNKLFFEFLARGRAAYICKKRRQQAPMYLTKVGGDIVLWVISKLLLLCGKKKIMMFLWIIWYLLYTGNVGIPT